MNNYFIYCFNDIKTGTFNKFCSLLYLTYFITHVYATDITMIKKNIMIR